MVVGWHVDDPAVDVVRTSDEHGMAQAVDHLVALGHRRIAHIDGGENLIAPLARDGVRQGDARRRGWASQIRVVPGGQTQLDGQRGRAGAPGRGRPADGDRSPTTTTRRWPRWACWRSMASTCPVELSVVGWDDSEAAALSPVGLTSVAQRPAEMARLAVERIVARIEGAADRGSRDRSRARAEGPIEHRDTSFEPNVLTYHRDLRPSFGLSNLERSSDSGSQRLSSRHGLVP